MSGSRGGGCLRNGLACICACLFIALAVPLMLLFAAGQELLRPTLYKDALVSQTNLLRGQLGQAPVDVRSSSWSWGSCWSEPPSSSRPWLGPSEHGCSAERRAFGAGAIGPSRIGP